jgi:hypothetical protein
MLLEFKESQKQMSSKILSMDYSLMIHWSYREFSTIFQKLNHRKSILEFIKRQHSWSPSIWKGSRLLNTLCWTGKTRPQLTKCSATSLPGKYGKKIQLKIWQLATVYVSNHKTQWKNLNCALQINYGSSMLIWSCCGIWLFVSVNYTFTIIRKF